MRLQDAVRRRGHGAAQPGGGPTSEVAAGPALQDHEDVFYHRDGTPIFVRCSNAPVVAAGKVTGAVLVVSDITGKRLADERLRASEERFRSLSACSPVGVFMTDVAGRWTYANPRLQALGGFRAAEGLGDGWLLHVHPQDRDSLATGWAEAARAGRSIEAEFRFQPPAGPERVVYLRSSPMLGDHGRLLGHVGSVEDVTDRRHMEDELRARAERLAEADRRKDEWVAMLAHELRGPLTPVRNAVQILRLGDVSGPQLRRACDMIARQVGHLAQIVDDLLDVTRLTRGAIRLRKERLDLGRLIRVAVDDHLPVVQQAGLALDTELPDTPVWVLGDDVRLAQVVNNLLENAVKFTPRGGRVRVRLSADGGSARLVVRDTGAGIDAELLPLLFDVFSQADRSLHRTGGGLGLGLAIVKSLAELHGGTVTAASEGPGQGAEFTVAIPTVEEPAALSPADGVGPKPGRHLRVLIVEDNRDAADSLRMLLELLGHETRVSYTGTDGLKAASEWRPDIILSDIGLPGLDGFGVARALRGNPLMARTRLIAITGYGSDDDRRRARESGFDFVLTKPAEPEALLRLLDAG